MSRSKFFFHKYLSPSGAVEGITDLLLLEDRHLYQIDFINFADRNFRNWYIAKDVSLLEAKETIEAVLLDELVQGLKMPNEAIRSFSEEAALNHCKHYITTMIS